MNNNVRQNFSTLPAIAMGIASALCLTGCGSKPSELSVFVSGDTAGWITPCGCAANQSGGLSRRATLVAATPREPTLYLDAGGSAVGTGPYQTVKLTYILRGLSQMGIAGHNIGGPESEFSPNALRDLGEASGVTWISSNLSDSSGNSVGVDHLLVQQYGLKILVLGIVDQALVSNPQWLAGDPVRSILKHCNQIQADITIVLAYFDETGLRTLAEALPEVDYIIGGPTGQAMSPQQIGPVRILAATNKGKFIAKLSLPLAKGQTPAEEIVEVASSLKEAPTQVSNVESYYQELGKHDFTAQQAQLVTHLQNQDASFQVAGSKACQSCHKPDQRVWHDSKHAHAFATLQLKHAQYDPHCQQCHTTGYALAGGFESVAASTARTDVGCENCHGPSQAHALDPRRRTPYAAAQQCARCHDHENSPEFDFLTYWGKVHHGKEK